MDLAGLPRLAFTPREVAQIASVDYTTVLSAIKRGEMPAKMKGKRRFLVLLRDVEAWLESLPDA